MCTHVCKYHSMHIEVRTAYGNLFSHSTMCGSWGSSLGHQAWQQADLPPEHRLFFYDSSSEPLLFLFLFLAASCLNLTFTSPITCCHLVPEIELRLSGLLTSTLNLFTIYCPLDHLIYPPLSLM